MTDERAHVLVVANRTAESQELLDALWERAKRSPARFTLLVPATPHGVAWVADMPAGAQEAEQHMVRAVERLRVAGLEIAGRVGDADPFAAVQDAVNFESFDEVIVSTLPSRLSRWLRFDLPRRVAAATGLPVTHVVGSETRAGALA
jgi:hypothetical protein